MVEFLGKIDEGTIIKNLGTNFPKKEENKENGIQDFRLFYIPEIDFGHRGDLETIRSDLEKEISRRDYPPMDQSIKSVGVVSGEATKKGIITRHLSNLWEKYPGFDWKILGNSFWELVLNWQANWPDIKSGWMATELIPVTDSNRVNLNSRKNLSYTEISALIDENKEKILADLGVDKSDTNKFELRLPTLEEMVYLKAVYPETVRTRHEWTSTKVKGVNLYRSSEKYHAIWTPDIDSRGLEFITPNSKNSSLCYRLTIRPINKN